MEKQIFPFFSTAIANHFTSIATETSKPLRVHAAKLSASSLCCALTYLQFLCVVQSRACSPFPFAVSIHCCSGPAIYFALTSPKRLRRFSIDWWQRKAISKPQQSKNVSFSVSAFRCWLANRGSFSTRTFLQRKRCTRLASSTFFPFSLLRNGAAALLLLGHSSPPAETM